jgi:tetratricopeptide (TPR) repeat protein
MSLVSILIRSMDRPMLRRALDAAAAQTHPDLELVVVAACGESHAPLPDAWGGRPLRFVVPPEPKQRPQAANLCLDHARGEWLNFLDDDDELLPEHVATLLGAPRAPATRLLYATARVHDAKGELVAYSGRAGTHMQLYNQNRCQPVAALFHRSLVDEGARFDPEFDVLEDQDFFVNCATRTEFQWVPSATSVWNGYDGTSGCGYGANADDARRAHFLDKLRTKWAAQFERWGREPDALLYLGQHHLKVGDLDLAVRCLEEALARLPDSPDALNLCAMANYHAGNRERALELLRRADRLVPGHPFIRGNLERVERG